MSHLLQLGLTNAIAAALLAGAVVVPAFVLRRRYPAVVHALWLLVLLKLVTPPLWKVPVSWHQPARDDTRAGAVETVGAATEESAEEWVASDETEIVEAPVPAPPPEPRTDWAAFAVWTVTTVWVGGSLACLALIVARSVRFRRLLRHAEPVPADVRRRAVDIASRFGLRECPGVWFVPGAVCPMLWALGPDARLLLPRGLWDRLDDDQRDTLVAHELAHLRRRDHWVRLVEVAATVLYWWSPVLWWARRGLREAEEQCCDAWVVWSMPAGVRHYMSAILEAVEFVSQPNPGGGSAPPAVPALASGMGEFRRLERRLWMIRRNECLRRLGRPGLAAILLAAGTALPLAPTLAQVENPSPKADVVEQRHVIVTTELDKPGADNAVIGGPDGSVSVSVDGRVAVTSDEGEKRIFDSRTGNVIEVQGDVLRITRDDDVEQARAEVEKLSAALAQAKQRLKELEKRGKGEKGGKSADIPSKKDAPTTYSYKRWAVTDDKPGDVDMKQNKLDWAKKEKLDRDDSQQRLDRLEEKLNKIDDLLNELRETKAKDRRSDKKNDSNNGPAKS